MTAADLRNEQTQAGVKATRILLIDRQRAFTEAIAHYVASSSDMRVVASTSTLQGAWPLIRRFRPNVAVIDIENDLESLIELRECPEVRLDEMQVALLTDNLSDRLLEYVLDTQMSCTLKADSMKAIQHAILQTSQGEVVLSDGLTSRVEMLRNDNRLVVGRRQRLRSLTPKQIAVLKGIASGQSVKQLARRLDLSVKSVEAHKYRIMKTLDIHDRVELCLFAVREELVRP